MFYNTLTKDEVHFLGFPLGVDANCAGPHREEGVGWPFGRLLTSPPRHYETRSNSSFALCFDV